jgi:glutathione S-transferase
MTSSTIFHLTTKPVWEAAVEIGFYAQSTLDQTLDEVGFIHASFPDQLTETAKLHYSACTDELVLLEMNIEALTNSGLEVKLEQSRNGHLFPHIYGPVPVDLVEKVTPYQI